MKLIINRGVSQKDIYQVSFGPDYDILIFDYSFPMNVVDTKVMKDIDYIVTNSPDLVFCVTHIKHPVLRKEYHTPNEQPFFGRCDSVYKSQLRNYFAIRLRHRRQPVEVIDFGQRLFH